MKKNYFSLPSPRTAATQRAQPKHSYGNAVPNAGMEGCLCADKNTYSKKCCKGYLINQGIGSTISPYPSGGGFSNGFSDGFQVVTP
jgi:hypothetical protein